MVPAALEVCSVPKTRWPVSAAIRPAWKVSSSRISPTRMTSGSSRTAARNASAQSRASRPISRWFTMLLASWWRYSIGSSIVRMWARRRRLTMCSRLASVVDLPEPVIPQTSIRPC